MIYSVQSTSATRLYFFLPLYIAFGFILHLLFSLHRVWFIQVAQVQFKRTYLGKLGVRSGPFLLQDMKID